ncbi:hypothetical protein ACIOD1_33535 [Streptomyces sp. NPDC088097]
MGTNLAGTFAATGHHVILGRRSPMEGTAKAWAPASPSPTSAPPPAPRTS